MNAVFNYLDTAPVLDLLFLGIWCAAIAALLGYAAWTIHTERQYRKKRERLIELASGDSSSSRDRQHAGVSSGVASPSDAASRSQDPFDVDHGHRPRVGLTRRGK